MATPVDSRPSERTETDPWTDEASRARNAREEANKYSPPDNTGGMTRGLLRQLQEHVHHPLGSLASLFDRPPTQDPTLRHSTQAPVTLAENRELAQHFYKSVAAKIPALLDEQAPLIDSSLAELKADEIPLAIEINPDSTPTQRQKLEDFHRALHDAAEKRINQDTLTQPQATFQTQAHRAQEALKAAFAMPAAGQVAAVDENKKACSTLADHLGEEKKALLKKAMRGMFGLYGDSDSVDLEQLKQEYPEQYKLLKKAGKINTSGDAQIAKSKDAVKELYEEYQGKIESAIDNQVTAVKQGVMRAANGDDCEQLFDALGKFPTLSVDDQDTPEPAQSLARFNADLQGLCQYTFDNALLGKPNKTTLSQQIDDILLLGRLRIEQLQKKLSATTTLPTSLDYVHARIHLLRENMQSAIKACGEEKMQQLDKATRETFGTDQEGKMSDSAFATFQTSPQHKAQYASLRDAGLFDDCADNEAQQKTIEDLCEAQCKKNRITVEAQIKKANQQLKDTELASHTLFDRLARDMVLLRSQFDNDTAMYLYLDQLPDQTGTTLGTIDGTPKAYDFTAGLKRKLEEQDEARSQRQFGYLCSVHVSNGSYSIQIRHGSTPEEIRVNLRHQLDMYLANRPNTQDPLRVTMSSEFRDKNGEPINDKAFELAILQAEVILNDDMFDVRGNDYYNEDYKQDDDPIKFDVLLKNYNDGKQYTKRFTMGDFRPPSGKAFLRAGSPEYNQNNNSTPEQENHLYTPAQKTLVTAWQRRQQRLEIRARLRGDTSEASKAREKISLKDVSNLARQQGLGKAMEKPMEAVSPPVLSY